MDALLRLSDLRISVSQLVCLAELKVFWTNFRDLIIGHAIKLSSVNLVYCLPFQFWPRQVLRSIDCTLQGGRPDGYGLIFLNMDLARKGQVYHISFIHKALISRHVMIVLHLECLLQEMF